MNIYECMKINQLDLAPLYQQMIRGMEKFCNAAAPGDPIPAERELCSGLKVSRTILRQALNECVKRGLLVKRWGKGYFVSSKERQKRILVVMSSDPSIANPYYYILPGIESRARELSIQLEILPWNFIEDKSESFIEKMLEQEKFTGILFLIFSYPASPAMNAFRKTRTPVYWPHVLDAWAMQKWFHCGCVDTRKAFREALQILIDSGSRRVVTLSQLDCFSDLGYGGIRGYTAGEFLALQKMLGIEADPELILECRFQKELIYRALDGLLEKKKSFDSILCMSDFYAIHAMSWLKEHHFRIPEDVSVMGYCGYPGGKFLDPPLSTIDYHYYDIGFKSVDRLLEIVESRAAGQEIPVTIHYSPYSVSVRESIRKPVKSRRRKVLADDLEITLCMDFRDRKKSSKQIDSKSIVN